MEHEIIDYHEVTGEDNIFKCVLKHVEHLKDKRLAEVLKKKQDRLEIERVEREFILKDVRK